MNTLQRYHLKKLLKLFREKIIVIKTLRKEYNSLRDILLEVLMNLATCQEKKIFSETPAHYGLTLEKVKKIVMKFKLLPTEINLTTSHLSHHLKECENLRKSIYEILNHISPKNFIQTMNFLAPNWDNFINDKITINFLNKMFNVVMVWDSQYHLEPILFIEDESKKEDKEKEEEEPSIIKSLLSSKGGNQINTILKTLTEMASKTTSKKYRKNHFSKYDVISKVSYSKKIYFLKNNQGTSMLEELNGLLVYVKLEDKYLVLQGYLQDDMLGFMKEDEMVKNKLTTLKREINYSCLTVPQNFRNNYLEIIPLRDLLTMENETMISELKSKFEDYKVLITKPLLVLINDFLLASRIRKKEILTLLLISDEDNRKLAVVLFDTLKSRSKTGLVDELYLGLPLSLRNHLDLETEKLKESEEKLTKMSESDIPYERRINLMNAPEDVKSKAMEKLKSIKNNFQGDSKASSWLDGLLKIPFGVYRDSPILSFKESFITKIKNTTGVNLTSDFQITNYLMENEIPTLKREWEQYQVDKKKYINDVREVLDEAVYGHDDAKKQIERIIGQWINGNVKGAVLGLEGPPGTGKTSLAKKGIAKCLKDADGSSRPFAFLPIGGSTNGSTLVGHNFTYVGSTWGRIADVLMTTGCMNPIIFIDEIDKVSRTEYGKEIISILTHLTDPTQNDEFEDKYFAGVKLDLSKALIIFSFNDISLIDPILRDRITVIETFPLSLKEKIVISQDYVLPEILKETGFNRDEIIFTEEIITYLIETFTYEAGIRKVKEKYYEIIREINLKRIFGDKNIDLPFVVSKEFINDLFNKKPKLRIKKIYEKPMVGLVNGLYATGTGIGGLTVIQVLKYPSDKQFELTMTGKQGEVMKESITYALRIAFGLLTEEKQREIMMNKEKFGLHIHTPEAAVPKDGPSAGAAITLAIYSILTDRPVNNKVAMTGEIDLLRRVTAIGGVQAKLNGAKRAGAEIALIPEENLEDLERLRQEGVSPEDETFKVIPVSHINQVIEYALLQ